MPHSCVAIWGASFDAIDALLDVQKALGGGAGGWAARYDAVAGGAAAYAALLGFKDELIFALAPDERFQPPEHYTPPLAWSPGGTVAPGATGVLAAAARAALVADRDSGSHVAPAYGWLHDLVPPGPTPPAVLDRAKGTLEKIRDAFDMNLA